MPTFVRLSIVMKGNIHPIYYEDAKVVCACGNTFTTGSTKQEIRVEICANCHPFFTGQQKYVDTLGKVERFQKRQEYSKNIKHTKKTKISEQKVEERPETLYEMAKKIKAELKSQES